MRASRWKRWYSVESCRASCGRTLNRDLALEVRVAGQVDGGHPAAPDLADDLVAADFSELGEEEGLDIRLDFLEKDSDRNYPSVEL